MSTAIVCGSGVAGLSAAIGLAIKGWQVDVYERDSTVREIGAGIFIKANGLRVLASFGLLDRIRRDCVVLQEARTLDKDGKVLQRRVLHARNPVWNIQRQLLIRALLDRATELGARVHTDHAVDAVAPDGTISIEDRLLRADLVVAADGVNSSARRALGLDRPVRAPLSGAIRLLVPRTNYETDDVVRESWSGRLRVGISPCTRAEVFSYLIAPLDDARGGRIPLDTDYWSAHFPGLTQQGFFDRAATAEGVHHRYPFVGTLSWVKGRVALVGDAAHALPPTLGQGAGLALTNTLLLSQYVASGQDLHEALAAWQQEWRWISDRTQIWARRYDWITSEWPRSIYPLRDAVIWGIGKSRRFNEYMRVADRVDASRRTVLPVADVAPPPRSAAPD
jgi:2-polyprenyl-6-methoxyphenol hydroxylase-like FAD-dependent oxidoreductase